MPTHPGRGRYHLTLSAHFIEAYVERAAEIRRDHPARAGQLSDLVNRLDDLRRDPHSPRHWRFPVTPPTSAGRREYIVEETLRDESAGRLRPRAVARVRYSVSDDDMNITLEDLALADASP